MSISFFLFRKCVVCRCFSGQFVKTKRSSDVLYDEAIVLWAFSQRFIIMHFNEMKGEWNEYGITVNAFNEQYCVWSLLYGKENMPIYKNKEHNKSQCVSLFFPFISVCRKSHKLCILKIANSFHCHIRISIGVARFGSSN